MTAAGQLVTVMLPMMMFMLIPLWIPLIAIAGGSVADRLADRRASQPSSPGT